MQTYRAQIGYDGRAFYGWQRLKKHPTIQGAMEEALQAAFGERTAVAGAGRTDRGAHAEGQVASFQLQAAPTAAELKQALCEQLPQALEVHSVELAAPDFHARSSAVGKLYEYRIYDQGELEPSMRGRVWPVGAPLDVVAMRDAVLALLGKHDFSSFATKARFGQRDAVRTLEIASVAREDGLILFRFKAQSFLNHMVRNMVRALVKVGEGRLEATQISQILAQRNRAAAPGTAPASGLYLMRVFYED